MSKQSRKVVIKESTGRRIIEQGRIRLLCVGLFFTLCYGSIAYRMVDVAVLSHQEIETITVTSAEEDSENEQVEIGASERVLQRGDIVDRNGMLLATSLMTASVFANPKEMIDVTDASKKLEKVLGVDGARLAKRLSSGKSFIWIKRNISPREQHAVNSLGIPGIYFLPEEKRVYPYGSLVSHVLGYVGIDNKGLAGMEKQFDRQLRNSDENHEPLVLSLDVRLQAIMHEELSQSIKEFNALGGVGIVLDLASDEILSMVSLPDFDPNDVKKKNDDALFNRASLGTYEMGSTFKTFTMALGLESGKASMTSGYDASQPLRLASFAIKDTHPKNRWLSVPEIFAYSSNIGTAKMALDVGGKKQREFLNNLGMMQPVAIELPEKGNPQYPQDWKDINTVTISYGHGIAVTPLHLVGGIAAVVGDGSVPAMTLLKDGNKDNIAGEKVVSDKTRTNLRRLMRLVVGHGTGSKADVQGYRVGGKTGTAEKITRSGGYNKDAKMALFVGAFPSDAPRFVMLVMIDEPKGNKSTYGYATGGWIAAPVAGQVIARMGPLLGIKPAFDVPEDDAEKFWVGKEDKPKIQTVTAPKRYIHAVSY